MVATVEIVLQNCYMYDADEQSIRTAKNDCISMLSGVHENVLLCLW